MTSTSTDNNNNSNKRKLSPSNIDRLVTEEECKFVLASLQQDALSKQDESPEFRNAVEKVRATLDYFAEEEHLVHLAEHNGKRMLNYVDLGVDVPLVACKRCRPEFVCRDCVNVPLTMCTACKLEQICGECQELHRRATIADRIGDEQTRRIDSIVDQVHALFESMRCGDEHNLFLGNMLENGAKMKASATTRGSIRAITKQRVNRRKLQDLKKERARKIVRAINQDLDRLMFIETPN